MRKHLNYSRFVSEVRKIRARISAKSFGAKSLLNPDLCIKSCGFNL